MRILSTYKADFEYIAKHALEILEAGGMIAYPTESFYALGVMVDDEEAVKRLCGIKNRLPDKAIPLIVGDMVTLLSVVKNVPDQARPLIKRFWPGPLSLIFRAREKIPRPVTGGTGKVAVRIPGESTALDLARSLDIPLTATSANPSTLAPACSSEMVIHYFGNSIDLIIDSGSTPGGKPSTIVDITVKPPVILRQGRVSID